MELSDWAIVTKGMAVSKVRVMMSLVYYGSVLWWMMNESDKSPNFLQCLGIDNIPPPKIGEKENIGNSS